MIAPRPEPRGPSRRSAAIVTGRLVLVAVAAGAAVAGFVRTRQGPATEQQAAAYTCPMHPDVVASAPGDCPICRMALVRSADDGAEHPASAHAPSSHEHAAHAHASAEDTPAAREEPDSLTLPAGTEVRGFDTVAWSKIFDTSLEMRASAWADGPKGGLALFHLDAAQLLRPGEEGFFTSSAGPLPGRPSGIPVRIAAAQPVRWDRSTVLVRFEVGPGAELSTGDVGAVKFKARMRKGLAIRSPAILHGPEGPYVLVVGEDRRTLTKRPVEIGSVLYGHTAVISGLAVGEQAVAKHSFVLDSERRLARRSTR